MMLDSLHGYTMAGMQIVLIFIGSVFALSNESSREPSNQNRILKELLGNYGYTTVRPVYNMSHLTTVELRMTVVQVIELNERHQTIEIGAWISQRWTDEYLKWDPEEYGGVDHLYVHKSRIWLPEITMYKNVDRDFESYKADIPVKVRHTGLVKWSTPAILKSTCQIDARLFPFDTQVCELRFASWVLHAGELNLTGYEEPRRKDFYTDVGVWEFLGVTVRREETAYEDSGLTYVDLSYFVQLRRRPLYHLLQIILPCLLLSLLNLMVFVLPPESGEKISLGVTNLLSLILFQQLISGNLPPTDKAPIIGFYFTPMIALSCTSIVCTVAVLGVFYRDNRRPIPRWVSHVVFGVLSRLVCHRTVGEICTPASSNSRPGGNSPTTRSRWPDNVGPACGDWTDLSGDMPENAREPSPESLINRRIGDRGDKTRRKPYDATKRLCTVSHHSKALKSPVMRANKNLCGDRESGSRHQRHPTRPLPSAQTWREVALVIDRVALVLSLLITLLSMVACIVWFIVHMNSDQQ